MSEQKCAHQVWFAWKPEASEEAIEAAMTALRALKDKIDVILELHCEWQGKLSFQ
jgi:Stress responsive A/B Barrel Domain